MAWGDKLVDKTSTTRWSRPEILLMVEYYLSPAQGTSTEAEADADSSPESEDEEEDEDGDVMIKVGKTEKPKISDELAELGFYTRFTESASDLPSFAPPSSRTQQSPPLHVLINISDSACAAIPTSALPRLVSHAQSHLRRVFPRGTRIRSSDLDPLVHVWRAGGHIPVLNCQRYNAGMQLNEGLIVGSPGWVLKPARLRGGTRTRWAGDSEAAVVSEIIGISARLDVVDQGDTRRPQRRRECALERALFAADDLASLRLTVMQSEFGRDDKIVVFCARMEHLQQARTRPLNDYVVLVCASCGFDMNGKNSGATLLVRFSVGPAE
ncbi:PLC-like phosphodiesterase [Mycena albidolilacea]|uniref:phosphoinositide phospholipase C n=1 Tax=Mycena albidolilacea TaxID=1033008 RepID=A0AAD7EGT4_9AGAR|nr:PLC-like phosphodiesterase [Mycena albidolilacea]